MHAHTVRKGEGVIWFVLLPLSLNFYFHHWHNQILQEPPTRQTIIKKNIRTYKIYGAIFAHSYRAPGIVFDSAVLSRGKQKTWAHKHGRLGGREGKQA